MSRSVRINFSRIISSNGKNGKGDDKIDYKLTTDFLADMNDEQKQALYHVLHTELLRRHYEHLLASPYLENSKSSSLSRFGRPCSVKEDPTGVLCEVPAKLLHSKLEDMILKSGKSVPVPVSDLWLISVRNALPFIGFGFLDNAVMILAGDYIDLTIGMTLGISTMAAAALGNTISDLIGISMTWYVEKWATRMGIREPFLTPNQMASSYVKWAINMGRTLGVTIGCLLGMLPLLFLSGSTNETSKTGVGDKK